MHFSWICLATTLAACLYNQTMFLSLLPTTTKKEAANSSTTLVSSYKRVCQNSENNLNNTHRGKKKGEIFTVHTIIYGGKEVQL